MDKLDDSGLLDNLDVLFVLGDLGENMDETEPGLVAGPDSGYGPGPVLYMDENEPGLV